MKRENLKDWLVSEYNEDSEDQLDYYINEKECKIGDKAYLYSYENKELKEMKIINIISPTDDIKLYEELIKDNDVLIIGEQQFRADTSAEFITDDNCYLVWFKYC